MTKTILTFVFLTGWVHGQDPYLDFPVADTLFRNGDLIGAKTLVEKGLKAKEISEGLRAGYLYMNGLLLSKESDAEEQAIAAFEEAIQIYQEGTFSENDRNYGIRICRLGLFNVSLVHGLIEETEPLLDHFLDEYQGRLSPREEGYALYLKARAAFLLGHYQEAHDQGRACLTVYEKIQYPRGIADAMVNLGRYLMMLGKWEEGYQMTLQAQEQIVGLGDADKYAYTLLNEALYQRCVLGLTGDIPLQLVDARLRRVFDKELMQTRDAVLQLMCAP